MKYLRFITLALCCLLILGMFVACNGGEGEDTESDVETTAADTQPESEKQSETEADTDNGGDDTEGETTAPAYTGPAIRNETWDSGDITPGSSSVDLSKGENDPSVEWN